MNDSKKADEITVSQLQDWIRQGKDFQLLDIREPFESQIASIGGLLIPKGDILDHVDEIAKDKDVVVYCRSGKRSRDVIELLKQKTGLKNLFNLKGGILAWADEIDPTITKY